MAIDFGGKRCGIAVTDPMKMIASPLETVETTKLIVFVRAYKEREDLETIVFGLPVDLQNRDTHITADVRKMIEKFHTEFPKIQISTMDERFTSKMAMDTMIAGGVKKKARADKSRLDKVSAAIILQSYLEQNS